MNAATDRKVVVALLTVVMVCLLCLGIQLYRSKAADLSSLQQQLDRKQKESDEVKAKIARMPELEAQYASVVQRLAVLEPALPTNAYIPTFLRQIENLAAGTGNSIVSIRPKKTTKSPGSGGQDVRVNAETGELIKGEKGAGSKDEADKGKDAGKGPELPYGFVPIELKIEGTYWSQIDFLKQLQRFPKMIAVNNVGFTPQSKRKGEAATSGQELAATLDLTAVVSEDKNSTGDSHGKAS